MKIPTSCEYLQSDLKAYLDGELSPPRRVLVRAHLLRCAECRAEVEFMKIIGQDLREDETARPAAFGDALRQRILDKLPAAPPTFDRAALRHSARLTNRRASFILAAGLATLVGVLIFPTTHRARENARKSSVQNNLKGIGIGAGTTQLSGGNDESADNISETPATAGAGIAGGAMSSDSISITKRGAPRFSDKRFTSESGSDATFSLKNSDELSVDSRVRGEMQQSRQRIAGLPPGLPPSSVRGANTDNIPAIFRRVHREARITVAVENIETQSDSVEQLVRGAGGYVVSNNLSTGSDNRKTATLDLRVPVARFETIIGEFSRLGDVRAKNVTGQDITEQYSDSQQAKNVLSNDLAIRDAQLKAALAKAAATAKRRQTPEDPWQLRAEVRRLRIEAAQVRARLEILRKLSDLSQITIELQEKKPAPEKGGFGKEMRDSGQAATDTFLAAARLPLKFLMWAFAYSPLWLPIVLFYRWLYPRRVDAGQRLTPPLE